MSYLPVVRMVICTPPCTELNGHTWYWANHPLSGQQLVTSSRKSRNFQGLETAVPAQTSKTSGLSSQREESCGRATRGEAKNSKGGRVQWTASMDAALVDLYEQVEPSKKGYAARLLSLWERQFPEPTGPSLSARLSRLRKLKTFLYSLNGVH